LSSTNDQNKKVKNNLLLNPCLFCKRL